MITAIHTRISGILYMKHHSRCSCLGATGPIGEIADIFIKKLPGRITIVQNIVLPGRLTLSKVSYKKLSSNAPTSAMLKTGPSTQISLVPRLQRPHLPIPQCMRASSVVHI